MPMESRSRVSIKGTNGLLTANVFSIHDPAWKLYIQGKSMVKKWNLLWSKLPTPPELIWPALLNNPCYYTLNSLTLFWLAKSIQWIFEIRACDIITADYTIIMSMTLEVMGNHVKFTCFVLLPIIVEAKTWLPFFFFVQCIMKQLLQLVFVISKIIKVLVRVVSVRLRLLTLTPI